jgi:hypothetical protein
VEQVVILLGLAFAANKLMSTLKNLTNAATRGDGLSQIVLWVIAILVLVLAGQADVTSTLTLPGLDGALGDLDFASYVVLGIIAGSTGSVVYDFTKAVDNTNSAAEPSLFNTSDGG